MLRCKRPRLFGELIKIGTEGRHAGAHHQVGVPKKQIDYTCLLTRTQ
jgi:hypothetical protein